MSITNLADELAQKDEGRDSDTEMNEETIMTRGGTASPQRVAENSGNSLVDALQMAGLSQRSASAEEAQGSKHGEGDQYNLGLR